MKRTLMVIALVGISLGLMMAYNNCAPSDVDFSRQAASVGEPVGSSDGPPVAEPSPPDVAGAPNPAAPLPSATPRDPAKEVVVIADKCKAIPNKEVTLDVEIEDPGKTCSFGQGDNLPRLQGFFTARTEQMKTLALPAGSKICDLKLDFPAQPFRYDDHWLFLLDGVVLAASHDFFPWLPETLGLRTYDWKKIMAKEWVFAKDGIYCEGMKDGLSQCKWPESEKNGDIAMSFAPVIVQKAMAVAPDLKTHSFGFVTVGDNDDTDCQHLPIKFKALVKYVE